MTLAGRTPSLLALAMVVASSCASPITMSETETGSESVREREQPTDPAERETGSVPPDHSPVSTAVQQDVSTAGVEERLQTVIAEGYRTWDDCPILGPELQADLEANFGPELLFQWGSSGDHGFYCQLANEHITRALDDGESVPRDSVVTGFVNVHGDSDLSSELVAEFRATARATGSELRSGSHRGGELLTLGPVNEEDFWDEFDAMISVCSAAWVAGSVGVVVALAVANLESDHWCVVTESILTANLQNILDDALLIRWEE